MDITIDTSQINTEKDFFVAFLVIEKVGQRLLRETPFQAVDSKFRDLVKSLENVKRNYLGITQADTEIIHEGVDPYNGEEDD